MTDTVTDMLIRIKNAQGVKKDSLEMPFSNVRREIARILSENGFLKDYKKVNREGKKALKLYLKYKENEEPALSEAKKISKPGQRIYKKAKDVNLVKNGYGIGIISTSKGVITYKKARKKHVGGELICEIW